MLNTKQAPSYAGRRINPERLQAILDHAGTSVLDVGCGNGAYVLELAQKYDIMGVDWQRFEPWDALPERFAISDAMKLDRSDASVDTVLSFETLEHLPDPHAALREYHRVCRKNVILTVPNCNTTEGMRQSNVAFSHYTDPTHVQFFTLETIAEAVESAGFRIVHRGYINHITLAPLLAEAFGWPDMARKVLARVMPLVQRRRYPLTCLVIGEKAE